jgi:hypothetical protein
VLRDVQLWSGRAKPDDEVDFMARFDKQVFIGQQIQLDGNEYFDCSFQRCSILMSGLGPFTLHGCSIENCRFGVGDPAAHVLRYMAALYAMGGEAQAMIEQVFNSIRTGEILGARIPDRSVS